MSLIPVSERGVARLAAATTVAPDGPGGNWSLIHADEFDGSSLNPANWWTCTWWGYASNYCSGDNGQMDMLYKPENVNVGNGVLSLTSQKQSGSVNGHSYTSTSGQISSGHNGPQLSTPAKFSYRYGYAEARVKAATGTGFESGFWLVPENLSWPPELDVMEVLGSHPAVADMTVHWRNSDGSLGQDYTDYSGPDYSTGWHTFGLDWEPTYLTWYVDSVPRKTFTDTKLIPTVAMTILANLDTGGSWIGNPDSTTPWPGVFQVDYVRIWQQATLQPTPVGTPPPMPSPTITPISTARQPIPTLGPGTQAPRPMATPTPATTQTPGTTPTPVPTQAPSGTLFSDDFESDVTGRAPAGWSVDGGTWQVVHHATNVVKETGVGDAGTPKELVAGSPAWSDYTVSVDVRAPRRPVSFGIAGRREDQANEYELILASDSRWALGKRVNSSWTTLASGRLVYRSGKTYRFVLAFAGDTITAAIAGKTLASVTDASIAKGNIGLLTRTTAEYDNVQVVAAAGCATRADSQRCPIAAGT